MTCSPARSSHSCRTARSPTSSSAAAERATGYVVGGISPLGQRTAHPTAIDSSALEHASILVSGGRRGLDVEIAPATLAELTDAVVAQLAV